MLYDRYVYSYLSFECSLVSWFYLIRLNSFMEYYVVYELSAF